MTQAYVCEVITWRSRAAARARQEGLEREVLEFFDYEIAWGSTPAGAFAASMFDWDV